MKEQDAPRAALLLGGLAKMSEESAGICKEFMSIPGVTIDDVGLPPDVWLKILVAAREILRRELELIDVEITDPGA